ncbi:MAG TPA: porin [Gemmatimonadales bacterium]
MTRSFVVLLLALFGVTSLGAQAPSTTTVGGYGEIHFTDPSNGTPSADVSRVVLYLAHTFDERLSFRSELEVEHARLEAGGSEGEVALEQAFLDYRFSDRFTLRSGLILIPIGIQNETHEPPTFNGVERTRVEHDVIPSTWREIGVGALGALGRGWSYRAYIVNGLQADGFTADEGIREGRQEGQEASFANYAVTGRLEWARPGLKVGLAGLYGGTADTNSAVGSGAFGAPMTVLAADARWQSGPWSARALLANVSISDAEKINAAYGADVGSRIQGGYIEGAYDLMPLLTAKDHGKLDAFVRYEFLNTQADVPSGVTADEANDRTVLVGGLTFRPTADVAFKADYTVMRNAASAGEGEQFALGLGFAF